MLRESYDKAQQFFAEGKLALAELYFRRVIDEAPGER